MKIVPSPRTGRDVEAITIWDGPNADSSLFIEVGRPNFYIAWFGEGEKSNLPLITFTEKAYNKLESPLANRLEYVRTDKEDEEGRVYFAMRRL